jgi:hypothetical protein
VCLIMAVLLRLMQGVWSNLYSWEVRNGLQEEHGVVLEVRR